MERDRTVSDENSQDDSINDDYMDKTSQQIQNDYERLLLDGIKDEDIIPIMKTIHEQYGKVSNNDLKFVYKKLDSKTQNGTIIPKRTINRYIKAHYKFIQEMNLINLYMVELKKIKPIINLHNSKFDYNPRYMLKNGTKRLTITRRTTRNPKRNTKKSIIEQLDSINNNRQTPFDLFKDSPNNTNENRDYFDFSHYYI